MTGTQVDALLHWNEEKINKKELKKAQMQGQIKKMHDKVKNDFESSAFYKKSKRLANISRSGSSKGVKL